MRLFSLNAKVSVLALALAALPGVAAAQTAAPGETDDNVPESTVQPDLEQNQPANDIVVTGSRIRRPDFQAPNPVVSLDSETLQASGTTNLTDFLTGYPALIGSSTGGDNSGSGAGIGYTGLNLLNLRNLGTDRTLVLVDGRRHVSGVPGSQAIDVNTIPTDLVERIDVLTGGASAIYGADGVSGVVNFILKKNFEGITARGQAGISEQGDAGQRFFTVTAGHNFGDRANLAIAYEYGKEDRLTTRDRRRLRGTNLTGFYLNPDDTETGGNNNDGIADYIPLSGIRYFDTNREGGIDVDWDGFPDYFVNAGGGLTAFDPGRFIPDYYQQGGNATLVSDYGNDLLPSVERHVVNAIGHFDVSPALSFFAEGKYANIESYSLGQPTFDYYLLIEPDNPFIPTALRQAAIDNGGLLLNRDNFDLGQRGETIKRETIRGVLGARGDLGNDFNYEVSYVYGQSKVRNHYVGDIYDDRFYAALDAVTGPNGQVTCRVNLQPGWSPNQPYESRDVFDPTTFQPGQCAPLNLFGENQASQAALDFIRVNTLDRSKVEQHVVNATLTGDLGSLFTLPGGDVGFAVGAEYREEKSNFTPDPIAAQGLTFTNALAVDDGKFNVKEVFGEVRVPLLSDRAFFRRLEFGGAVRLSDYSTIGTTTTWKVDGTWAPVRDITFNGTYSRAVRAPNIGELFGGLSQTYEFITDPCNSNQIQNGTANRAANCAALLTSLGVADPAGYRDPRSTNIPGFQGGNPDLGEEAATTWTAGAVFQPRFIPGLTLRADWYDIKLKNAINFVDPEELAELCVDQASLDNVFCGGIVRQNGGTTAGQITGFTVTPQNVAQFVTAGLDVNINYRLNAGKIGKFNLNLVGNYLDRLEFIGTPGAPVTDSRGEAYAPKYTANFDLTWTKGPYTINYGLSWFDKTLRFTNQEVDGNPDIVAPEYLYYKERWVHDLYASVDVGDNMQFFGGVNNFLGERPSIGANTYPVSSVGRFFFAGARVKFAGF
ncbi:TonB-dependent receptor [Sphingomonas parva]|uniref:TonB-dependent receptor n=1 Tax=Sphingomonas parva TaxID=2555898 RepID=A0A4Y8ZWC7_9SPHN|nr:TonB-dependent receptor [Sphingomonas parva]TFI60320.1 TonB-dependent receptor [Sphingomonas parva]